jgi:hypothetical protein
MKLSKCLSLSAPKTLYVLGFIGVALAVWNLVEANIAELRGLRQFNPAYHLADEALAFAGAVTLLIAARLDGLDKRMKILEEKAGASGEV